MFKTKIDLFTKTKMYWKNNQAVLLLFSIILIAFFYRIYNINLELPSFSKEIGWTWGRSLFAIRLFSQKATHPPLYQILLLIGDWLYFLFGYLIGLFKSPMSFEIYRRSNFINFFILGRFINIIISLINIYVIYAIGKKIQGRKTGLVAAIFLAFSYPHIIATRVISNDILVTLLLSGALLFILDIIFLGDLKSYLKSGFVIGLAITAKYTGGLALFPFIIAHFLNKGASGLRDKKLYLGLSFVFLGFLAGFPTLAWDMEGFFNDTIQHFLLIGTQDVYGYALPGWLFGPKILYAGMGGMIAVTSILGIIYCLLYLRKKNLLLISLPVFFYLIMCCTPLIREHWLLPAFPFLLLISAYFIVELIGEKKLSNYILIILVIIMIFPSAIRVINYEHALSEDNLEEFVNNWKKINIPEEKTLTDMAYNSLVNKKFSLIGVIPKLPSISDAAFIYHGPTIMLFGTIIFKDYRGAPLFIVVRPWPYAGQQDIATVAIQHPGKYSISVPVNSGRVNVVATPLWGTIKWPYAETIVNVGDSNISDVDMVIR